MSETTEPTWLKNLRQDMRREVRDLTGPGYVPEYYAQLAEPFVRLAQAYVEEAAEHAGKVGAAKAARHLVAYSWSDRMDWNSGYEVLEAVREEAGRIESGEVTP